MGSTNIVYSVGGWIILVMMASRTTQPYTLAGVSGGQYYQWKVGDQGKFMTINQCCYYHQQWYAWYQFTAVCSKQPIHRPTTGSAS